MKTKRKQKMALLAALWYLNRKKKRKHKFWSQPWLGDCRRYQHSFVRTLEPVFATNDQQEFRKYVRMDYQTYSDLLLEITPLIMKKNSKFRQAITPREKLSITLSYLAEGMDARRLGYEYRVGRSTVHKILWETIHAINKVLIPNYLQFPSSKEEWATLSQEFSEQWDFPNCIGAMDGKHVHMFPPYNSGSFYYNYKEGFSIVLLGLIDAEYKFIGIDVGANGRVGDANVWSNSKLKEAVTKENLPEPAILPNSNRLSPFVIVADSGFALEENVMRPYPERGITVEERLFNYRLSRARRVSEHAFGILANRWRILLKRLLLSPSRATELVICCCCLHNLLRSKPESRNIYVPDGYADKEDTVSGEIIPGKWRQEQLVSIQTTRFAHNFTFGAGEIRDNFKNYFNNEGTVSWQNSRIGQL